MKKLLFVLASVAVLTSCKKEVDELPEPTQTGANIFGAKLNGEFWVPQKFGIAPTAPILEARYTGTGGVFINARNFGSSPTETEFEIYLENISQPGLVLLNESTLKYPDESASYGYYIKRRFMPEGEWITGPQHTGSVTVTRIDKINNIISGTFQFTAKSMDNTADPITVTEGRFDVMIQ